MKSYIAIMIIFASAIVGIIAEMMYIIYGWRGVAAYLFFACLCFTPTVICCRRILKEEKGGSQ